ncbi:hypothetical protein MES5069_490068 [Mesorhizobium escarrei]|uniref:Uncharacterized protein n=1 Tax=Mesorhizobium escarrei TaxID=666018 RepID=A0ABM9EAA8_9HYPH|nr:hypothetical protein MES5069_490068 [Mesorhizobium escarrei]
MPKEQRFCFEPLPWVLFSNWHGACFVHFHKKPIALLTRCQKNEGTEEAGHVRFDTPIAYAVGAAVRARRLENLCHDPLEWLDHESRLNAQPFVVPFALSLAVLCNRFMPGSRDLRLKPGGGL